MDRIILNGRRVRALSSALSLWVACAILVLAPAASAFPIIEWNIGGSDGQTASIMTSVALVSGTDLVPVNVTPWPGGYCCFTAASDWGTSDTDPDLTKFYEFSVSAASGHSIVYEDISLSLFRGVQGGNHGAELWELRASHDGYTGTLALFDLSGSAADEQIPFSAVDISAVGTQAGTVSFRLYGYDYTAPSDYSGLGNHPGPSPLSGSGSDLVVGGHVVPEPRSLAQLGLGLAMLAFAGRKRGRA